MSKSSSKSIPRSSARPGRRWWLLLGLPLWAAACFFAVQWLIGLVIGLFGDQLGRFNPALVQACLSAAIYILTLVLIIGVPWWLLRLRTTSQQLGVSRSVAWLDVLVAPLAYVACLLVSLVVLNLITGLVPQFDAQQTQEVGFSGLTTRYEYWLAFATLVMVAPLAEELLFRGYLYGKLRAAGIPFWIVALVVSAVFAAAHGQWNVAIDTFILSLGLCVLRAWTGSIWAGMVVHMIKNGLAFYLLFINPTLMQQLQSAGGM